KEAGFFMIFYLAALQSLSPSLAEAASIEGASRWYFFRRVTFPLLMPTTLFVLVNAVINACRVVDHIVVMTRGGPAEATELLLYYIYEIGFRFWDPAYAAALTMVLLAVLGLLALAQFGFLERRVHYQCRTRNRPMAFCTASKPPAPGSSAYSGCCRSRMRSGPHSTRENSPHASCLRRLCPSTPACAAGKRRPLRAISSTRHCS